MSAGNGAPSRPDVVARLLRARAEHGGVWIEVDGRSMLPTIRPPARVHVVACRRPRMGEVWVIVADDGEILAHRFIRRLSGDLLRFKGDNTPTPDQSLAPERLVGRVICAVGEGGRRPVRRRPVRAWIEAVRFGVARRVRPRRERL